MRIRDLQKSDIPILQGFADTTGFPYPSLDHPHIEAILVVVDSEDKPITAAAAKRLIEIYGWVDSERSPMVLMAAWKILHQSMAETLRAKGYNGCESFIPPQIAKKFGRRLERTWGWIKNWQSWTLRF